MRKYAAGLSIVLTLISISPLFLMLLMNGLYKYLVFLS